MSRDREGADWIEAVERQLGPLRSESPVAGGDIAESRCATLRSGDRIFLKRYPGLPPGVARAEATGLAWLAEARALRVPVVVAVGDDWLALEWIDSGRPAPDFDEQLGRGLARLHGAGADRFGLSQDNWIGRLPQRNATRSDWASFYADARLRPLRELAWRRGPLPASLASRLDRLIEALPELVGPQEPPSRLHGDLWSGNVLVDESGRPCLIDPAVYGGHREMDLAMMRLFGGFDERSFHAYAEAAPLAPGAERRVPLYQVYPLLVHVALFGRAYVDRLARAVDAALAVD